MAIQSSRRMIGVAAVALGVAMVSGPVVAQNANNPKKADKGAFTIVRAYEPCIVPNDTTALGLPTCAPAVASDTVCDGFTANGSGKSKVSVKGQGATADVHINVAMKGLQAGCEGETLCPAATLHVTTQDCVSGDPAGCTLIDLVDFQLGSPATGGCCVVTNGKCKIKTTLATNIMNVTLGGQTETTQVDRTSLTRVTGPGAPATAFRSGLFVP
jgi:hypothetical protein